MPNLPDNLLIITYESPFYRLFQNILKLSTNYTYVNNFAPSGIELAGLPNLQISVLQTRFEKIIFATYDGNILTPLFHCTKLSIDFSQTPKFYYFTNNPEHPYYEFLQTSAILEIFHPRVLAPGNIALNIESLPLSLFQTNILPQQNVGKNILLAIEYFPKVPLPPAEPEPELPNEPEPDQPVPEPEPVPPVPVPPVLHMYFGHFILIYNHRNPEHISLYKSFLSSYIPEKVHDCLNLYQTNINKCKKQLNFKVSFLSSYTPEKVHECLNPFQTIINKYKKQLNQLRSILTLQKIIEFQKYQHRMDFLKKLPYEAHKINKLEMFRYIFGAEEKGDGYRMSLADILTYPNKIPEGYIRLDANNGDGQCFAQAAEMASSLQNAFIVIEPIIHGNHYHAVVAAPKNELYPIIYHVMKATINHYNTAQNSQTTIPTAASMGVTQDISFGIASLFSNQYSIFHDYSTDFPQSDTQKSLGILGSANNDTHFVPLDATQLIGLIAKVAITTAKTSQLSDKITSYQDADDATKSHLFIDIATSAVILTANVAGKSLPGGLLGQTTLTSVPHIGYALWQGDVQTAKAHTKIAVENITEYGLLLGGLTAAGISLPAASLAVPVYQFTKTALGYFSDWYYAESDLQTIMSRHETSVETQLADNQ
jgi:hypothetical protein